MSYCFKSYSSFILSKNALSVKHSMRFDFSFAFLSDIKTAFFGCVYPARGVSEIRDGEDL